MRALVINANYVTTVIEVASLSFMPGLVEDLWGSSPGWIWDGKRASPPSASLPTVDEYVAAVQAMLDAKAQERRYDNILSACTYATSANEKFQAEGQACVAWRDAVWARCYDLLGQVNSGAVPQPTLADLLAMLPALEWPA